MAKSNTIFKCSRCDAQYPKWVGRCSECGNWGTISEVAEESRKAKVLPSSEELKKFDESKIVDFKNISVDKNHFIPTSISELDRVLGNGIVPGSLILIGGEPGIGKSTLVLQIASAVQDTLYISGEESAAQIKTRVDRLNVNTGSLSFLAENNIESVVAGIVKKKPALVIIDSIQTLYSEEAPSEPGSVTQVRICTVKLLEVAKKLNIPTFIIGHVTKEGQVAGPKTMEHLVDTVLYLESSKNDNYRILRSAKNRFGSTNEIGLFEMASSGLIEVSNPSELFMPSDNKVAAPGSILTCIMEGSRPFIVEIQALVSKTVFGYPQRKASGYDTRRMQMLLAVLSKRASLPLIDKDVHLNVTGGLKITETGADLGIIMAIVSSLKDVSIVSDTIIFGEVGLSGEIRPVSNLTQRIKEAEKLHFKHIITPRSSKIKESEIIKAFSHINEAIDYLTK